MEKLSSTSAVSQSSIKYVEIKAMEAHGFTGHYYRNPKPFDIKEDSDDKIINIYANFSDKKAFCVRDNEDYQLDKNLIIDTGLHVSIPRGYALYVFSDDEIEKEYGTRLYHERDIFTGYYFPFQLCITHIRYSKKVVIDDRQLIARACVIPFPHIDINTLAGKWNDDIFFQFKKISIKTNVGCDSSMISGGSGWTRPINTNSKL